MTLYTCVRQSELEFYRQVGMEPVGENCVLVEIDGCTRHYLKAYLSPADCPGYNCEGWQVVAVEVVPDSCYIAEGAFASSDVNAPDCLPELFQNSVIPMGKYRLGQYCRPICLVPGTDRTLSYLNEKPGKQPALYDLAEDMYGDRIFDKLTEGLLSKRELTELACKYLVESGRANVTQSSNWDYIMYETDDGEKFLLRRSDNK